MVHEKTSNNIPPLRNQNLSKKEQEKNDKTTYRLPIIIVMIGNSRYIGTYLSGVTQEVKL